MKHAVMFGLGLLMLAGCGDSSEGGRPDCDLPEIRVTADRTQVPPVPKGKDILEHLLLYPGSETVTVDGVKRAPRYGDYDVEQAEIVLTGKLKRPWTVARVLKAFEKASTERVHDAVTGELSEPPDEEHRAALIHLLAASRTPEALFAVGTALADEQLAVRVAATYGLLEYWSGEMPEGGTECAMFAAADWWKKHREKVGR